MKNTKNTEEWMRSGGHLPKFMRDFHDQKDLFKAIDEIIITPANGIRNPTWAEAHVYVIDVFLWFMARRGYTLQRTRFNGDFRDVEADVAAKKEQRDQHHMRLLAGYMSSPQPSNNEA